MKDEGLLEIGPHYPVYSGGLDNEKAFEKAKEEGCKVVIPDDHTLTLDIDAPCLPSSYYKMINKLYQHFTIKESKVTFSKSGNLHVYLTFQESFTDTEKILLQALLGSDPVRELMSFLRVRKGNLGHAILMFEKENA